MTNDANPSFDRLNAYIKEHHLRRTFEREKLLEYILKINGHFTAQSLYKDTYNLYHISRATIYNILDLFLNAGLIIRHPFPGSEAQYEATSRAATHHHMICTICGSVKEFTDQKYIKAIKSRKFSTFEVQSHSIYLYGICKKCSAKQNRHKKRQSK